MRIQQGRLSRHFQVNYIGYFETEEGAARAYDTAVVQARGSTAQVREMPTAQSGCCV